jgi:hypothetical protein
MSKKTEPDRTSATEERAGKTKNFRPYEDPQHK